MQRPRREPVTLDDILITEELSQRSRSVCEGESPRSPNWQAEAQAMQSLARQMASDPETMLQSLVDIALHLCSAGTAGVSLLETTPEGEEIFRAQALAGTLAHHVGGSTPRNFCPCGVCLEQNSPVLFSHPERYFTYFQAVNTPIVEGLVLPLIADRHVFGTIWIVSHDEGRQFDSEDLRIMTGLVGFTAAALLTQRQNQELRRVNVAKTAQIAECKQAEARSHALISSLPGGAAFVVDRDLRYLLAEGEALATAGFKPEDFVGRTIFEVLPPELAASYEPIYRQALAGEPFEHEHNAHDRTYISRGTPLRSANGEVYAVLAVSYDITNRRQAETAAAADLEDMQRLRELSARLVSEGDIQAVYQEIVATAIALTHADAGSIQILDEVTQDLVLLATQGITPAMIEHFYRVNADSNTPCGIALTTGERTFVDFDVPESEDPHGSMRMHVEAGLLSAQSTPLFTRSGKAIGMFSTHWRNHHRPSDRELRFLDLLARQVADLIEQRQAQVALRESEERLGLVVNLVPDLLWDSEPDGSTNWYNQRWMEYTGQTFEQAIGWGWVDAIHPGDREASARRYREAVEQGVLLRQEHRIRRHDGEYRWFVVNAFPLKDESGKVVKMYGAATDIHEQRVALEALRESEERFRTLANTAPALIWYNDAQGNNRFINQYFQDFTGKSAEQIHGEGWHTLVHPDDAELYIADYLAAVREQRSWHNRNRICRHDGVWRWHENYAQPLFSADGVYLGHVGVTIDNTDVIEAEIALRESEEKYRTLFETMDEGLSVLELVYDDSGKPVDMRWIEANSALEKITGLRNVAGRLTSEIVPTEQYWLDAYDSVVKTGEPLRYENYHAGMKQWYRTHTSRIGGPESRQVANFFEDITARKCRELNTAFLDKISKDLSLLSAPDEIIQTVGARLGEFLQASGCIFADVDEAKNEATIHHGWNTADVPSLKQTFRLADYFGEEFLRAGRAGESVIVRDTARDSRANAETYARLKLGGFVTVPFQRQGRWTANITVTSREPRDWRADEIELLQEIASRVFPRIERARAEEALRMNEKRTRIQKEAFQSAINGEPLASSLNILTRIVKEQLGSDVRTAFYLAYPDGASLYAIDGAGDMPQTYTVPVEGFPIGEESFCSGYAIATGRPALTRDVFEDPVWQPYLHLASAHNFRSCGSYPILTREGKAVGSFAMYFTQVHEATRQESAVADAVTQAAAIILSRHTQALERARAEEALRESEEKYRSLFESIDAGFCIFEMLYNDAGEAIDFRYIETNPAFERQSGRKPQPGQTMRELFPEAEDMWLYDYAEVARTGQAKRFIDFHQELDRWFDVFVFPASNGRNQLAALFSDVTEEKRAEARLRESEERQAFLLQLSDAIKPLTDPVEIMATVSEIVGRYYNVGRCGYAEVPPPYDDLVVARDWTNGIMQSLQGSLPLVVFGDEIIKQYRTGQTIVVEDAFEDARNQGKEAGLKAAGNIRSSISVQLVKQGKWAASFYVQDTVRRSWTQNEVDLMEEIAERTWSALQRARAEEALSESEAKYRSLFDTIDEGFAIAEVIYDSLGQPIDILYLEANPAASRMTGVPDYTRRRMSEVLPTVEPYWVELYDRVARTGVSERTEQYAAPLDRWYDFYVFRAEAAESSESRRVAVIFQDITDRKRTEAQLRRAAEIDAFRVKLADALRSLTDPVEIQAVATRLLGEHLKANQVHYGETIGDYVVIQQGYGNGSPPMVGRFRFIDLGERLIANYRAGRTTVSCDVFNDPNITEAERRTLVGAGFQAYIAVPLTKAEGWVATLAVHSIVPRDWTTDEVELVKETAERTWATIERARAEAALRESELQRVREQSAREQERQRAESLAELDRAKTLFFTNISHEFRTPLTLSLAPLQDVLSDRTHPLAQVQRERLELAHRNTTRLLKLVNTLLDFSRIEAGRMEAVYEATDLALLTTELASVFRSAIERAGLRLIVDCPPLPEPVYVDREMWEKIVLNLLSNAFKFTLEGEIAVRLHPADGDRVTLQIQDTGTGIPPEELPHLFEQFYQVRRAASRTHEGSGIGLALVQELIKMHGGTIDVSSVVGHLTCFTVTIPLGTAHLPSDRLRLDVGDRTTATRTLASTTMGATAYVEEAQRSLPIEESREYTIENAQEQTAQTADSSFPMLASARVLLVDDNADMREYLTRILSDRLQVEAVADGATALYVATARVPDLILSDVMMPGLDGFELLQALRSDPRTREIPIILLSARAGVEAIVEGLQAGADDYLIKPFSAQELLSRVNAHLQMAQLRGEALQEARSTIRSRDEFISVVSHELNTPLVSILGWTRLLRSNPPSPVMLTKALDTIERNATLQAKLVQDLLDISRIAAGKLRSIAEPVELEAVIETAMATVTQMAQTKGIDLNWHKNIADRDADSADSIVVMGDRDRLRQVICNLLSNAIKFTPESGSVTIELSVIEDDHSPNTSCARICVSDTGIGIAADFLPHVFERFRQARDSDAVKGMGLGLAIARHIVELHNGTIHAQSSGAGLGATFTVELPILKK